MISMHTAIGAVIDSVEEADLLLSTTGFISRTAHFTQDRSGNFYMIGSMGLLSSLGLGLALMRPDRRVVVLDGDGSALMSMGTMALIASESPQNLLHVVLDNEVYESTGSQPSISSAISLASVAEGAGYAEVLQVDDLAGLKGGLADLKAKRGPALLLVKALEVIDSELPRVSLQPAEIRDRFRDHIVSLAIAPTR